MPTIIDGYNLIFTCGLEGKNRTPQTLERARARLISILAEHHDDNRRKQITIVFDAKRLPVKETEADSIKQGIRILYAVDYEDADTLIEELIRKHSSPKKLTVVSSDHRIQTAATRRKARAIDSDVWLDRMTSRPVAAKDEFTDPCKSRRQSSSPDTDQMDSVDWAAVFQMGEDGPSSDSPGGEQNDSESGFNPFPKGYGEDLLDEPAD